MKKTSDQSAEPKALCLRLPNDVLQMLSNAKAATGRSKTHLLVDAVRSKYSKFLPLPPSEDKQAA